MRYRYEATHVAVDHENDALIAAFGGLPDADGHPTVYLILQRSTDANEDEPGLPGVYAEWCAEEMACYGCVRRFDLYRDGARVLFNEAADFHAPEGEGDRITELEIAFTLAEEEHAAVAEGLAFVLKGCEGYAARPGSALTGDPA